MGRRKAVNRTPEEVLEYVQQKKKNNKKLTVSEHLTLQIEDTIRTRINSKDRGNRYSPELKANALILHSQGCTVGYISQALKIPHNTISQWVNSTDALDKANIPSMELLDQIKDQLPKKLYLMANRTLSSVSDYDLEKASLQQKATATAIMIDKARLLEGNSTQNIATVAKHVHSLDGQSDEASTELLEMEAEIARLDSVIDSL